MAKCNNKARLWHDNLTNIQGFLARVNVFFSIPDLIKNFATSFAFDFVHN